MKIYHINTLGAALVFSLLCLLMVFLFVMLPVLVIQWLWNLAIAGYTPLPQISWWQAGLLYLAGAIILHLFGLVRISFETQPRE